MADLQIVNDHPDRYRESSIRARVEKEMRIPTADEDEFPRVEELELSSATCTKMLARICET